MKENKEQKPSLEPKAPADPLVQILIVISVIISTLAIYFMMTSSGPKPGPKGMQGNQEYSSTWSKIGENFTLMDTEGAPYSSGKLRGKPNLIYFGFTYCPDICPTELQKMSAVMNLLEKDHIDVIPVFITIDPKRDTPQILKLYLSNFHNKFVGLTGTDEQIKKVTEMFSAYYEKADSEGADNPNYMMNHTAYIYLVNKYGKFVRFFDTSSNAEEIATAVKEYQIAN
jgi:protein SCO1/2